MKEQKKALDDFLMFNSRSPPPPRSRFFLQHPANPDLLYIIFFCHSQLTITILLCLIFASKVSGVSKLANRRFWEFVRWVFKAPLCPRGPAGEEEEELCRPSHQGGAGWSHDKMSSWQNVLLAEYRIDKMFLLTKSRPPPPASSYCSRGNATSIHARIILHQTPKYFLDIQILKNNAAKISRTEKIKKTKSICHFYAS